MSDGCSHRHARSQVERDWRRLHRPGHPGKIDRDPEVKAFVDANLAAMTFMDLAQECRARFGADRAPSKSSLSRYWNRARSA